MSQDMNDKEVLNANKVETLFRPSKWIASIDFIKQLVLLNNVLIAVLAEEHGGKTSFVELLQPSFGKTINTQVVTATPTASTETIMQNISSVLGIPFCDEINFASIAHQINLNKEHVLLIVDDAHFLPYNMLQDLLHEIKRCGDINYFHICLLSDYTLATSLKSLDAEQFSNFIHTMELGGLTESETKTYLLKKLPLPKRSNSHLIDALFQEFYHQTGGHISRINREMEYFFNNSSERVSNRHQWVAKRFGVTASALLVLLASGYFLQNQNWLPQFQQWYQETMAKKPEIIEVAENQIKVLDTEPTLVSTIPPLTVASISEEVQPSPHNQIVELDDEEEAMLKNLVVMDGVVPLPKPLHKHVSEETPQIATQEQPVEVQQKVVAAESRIEPIIISEPTPVKEVIKQPRLSSGKYTIQVMASSSKRDVQRFLSTHPNLSDTNIRVSRRDGMNWYVLTVGEYSRRGSAQLAIRDLPSELTRFNPWIRSVSSLKQIG